MTMRPLFTATLLAGLAAGLLGFWQASAAADDGPGIASLSSADQAARFPNRLQHFIELPQPSPLDLTEPRDVVQALDGRMLVLEATGIRVYAADGAFLETWALPTSPEGPSRPMKLALAPAGSPRAGEVYVSDLQGRRIHRFSETGAALGSFLGQHATGSAGNAEHFGLSVDPQGRIWTTQHEQIRQPDGQYSLMRRVRGFGSDGGLLQEWDVQDPNPAPAQPDRLAAIAAEPTGTLLIASLGSGRVHVQRYQPDGQLLETWPLYGAEQAGQLQGIADLDLLPGGGFALLETRFRGATRFVSYDDTGSFQAEIEAETGITRLLAVAPSASGGWLGLGLTHRGGVLEGYDAAGRKTATWVEPDPLSSSSVSDLAAEPDGTLYYLDPDVDQVVKLDGDGRPLLNWGSPGFEPGQLRLGIYPAITLDPDGSVLVAEDENFRIQRFNAQGRPLESWQAPLPDGSGVERRFNDIGVAPDGKVYVAGEFLSALSADGQPLQWLAERGNFPGRLGAPGALGIFQDGSLVVSDGLDELSFYDAEGRWQRTLRERYFNEDCSPREDQYLIGEIDVAPSEHFAAVADRDLLWMDPGGVELERVRLPKHLGDREVKGLSMAGAERIYLSRPSGIAVYGLDPPATWRAEYFDNPWQTGWPKQVDAEAGIDLAWGVASPGAGMPERDWSARFSRVLALQTGQHRLKISSTGGVRVAWNGEILLDAWDRDQLVDEMVTTRRQAGDHHLVIDYRAPEAGSAALASIQVIVEQVDDIAPSPTPSRTAPPTYTPVIVPRPTASPWPTRPATRAPFRLHLPLVERAAAGTRAPQSPLQAASPIDVEEYAVALRVSKLGEDVQAGAIITLTTSAELSEVDLYLEASSIVLTSVEDGRGAPLSFALLDGQPTEYGLDGGRVRISLGRQVSSGERIVLHLAYSIDASALARPYGMIHDPQSPLEGRILYTRSAHYYTRHWLPSNDSPDDAARVRYTLRVPDGMLAAANGALEGGDYRAGSGLDADGLRVFRWRQDEAIPTYLFQVVMGELEVFESAFCYDETGPNAGQRVACDVAQHRVPIAFLHPRSRGAAPDSLPASIDAALDMVAFYSSLLEPYPFAKLGFVHLDVPFGMEYASLNALNDSALYHSERIENQVSHLLLHAWFGGREQIGHWGDLWLTEGFASYLMHLWNGFELEPWLCACPGAPLGKYPETDPNIFFDPYPSRFGARPACEGAGALHDLHLRMSRLAGHDFQSDEGRALFLAVVQGLYAQDQPSRLDGPSLVRELPDALEVGFAAEGIAAQRSDLEALTDDWEARWLR